MSDNFVFVPPQTAATLRWADRLRTDVPQLQVQVPEDEASARGTLATAVAAFGTISPELLRVARDLRWLQAPMAGPPPGYYYQELVEHPVVVTNFRGLYNDHVAIHAMALALALARNFQRYLPKQMAGQWDQDRDPASIIHLPEATVLIIGVGGIGSELVRYCRTFGLRVLGTDARITDLDGVEMHGVDELDALLPEADIVIMTVPHTPSTEGLMGRDRFKLMRDSAVLVNVGRGPTVVLDDLVAALNAGEIAGAGLDVFEIEPLPADHALWSTPGVILTPHTATTGPYLDERRYGVLRDNARAFVAGARLKNVVDKVVWF